MAKQITRTMLSVKTDDETKELLKILSETESRSQGKEVEHLVKKEAKRLNIKPPVKQ